MVDSATQLLNEALHHADATFHRRECQIDNRPVHDS